ncbi:MAG: SRPBCC domain-containing protein [Micrococcales bacterium]|nr:SRPBCC domain-containing protein [Micrococcales bacterium]OJX66061.1 MAG: hypothetical protein BGO94_03810 [Micrococcales bacterium 72-143]
MTADRSITVTRRISAPPATVFRYWTDPQLVRGWYAPVDEWIVGTAEITPGVGGGYHITFGPAEDADAYTEKGSYLVYDPPHRLMWDGTVEGEGADDGVTRIEITFAEDGDGTLVTVVESGMSAATAEEHEQGWAAGLEKLAATVEAAAH